MEVVPSSFFLAPQFVTAAMDEYNLPHADELDEDEELAEGEEIFEEEEDRQI